MVADTDRVVELDPSGSVVQTYCLGTTCNSSGVSTLFGLNILPAEDSFLTGDLSTGMVYQVSIGSGTLEQAFDGLHGQSGTRGGGGSAPEPSTLILLAGGAGLLALRGRLRKV